jgi:TonB family protein
MNEPALIFSLNFTMINTSNLQVAVFCVMLSLSNSFTLGMGIPQSPGAEAVVRRPENVLRKDALRKIEAQYPAIAKAARAQGEVKVELVIDSKGSVISAQIVSGHPLLREPVLAAARQWVFKPAVVSGKRVKMSGILTFRFVLDGKAGKKDAPIASPESRTDPVDELCDEGERLRKEKRFDEAIGKFRKALSIKPDYPWAHYQLGITYTEMQRLEDAEASCALALKLRREELKRDGDGEQDWVLVNSLMCLGLVESFLDKYDEAIAHFRKVAELEKAMYDVRMYLGAVLKTKGDHEAAIVALKESVALQPHPNALYLLGEIYLEQSRWKEAIESYKQSLEFEDGPHISPSHHGLGIAFLRIGDRQAAMTHYQELKKLDTKRAEQLLHEINK